MMGARVRMMGARVRVMGARVRMMGARVRIMGARVRMMGARVRMMGARANLPGSVPNRPCSLIAWGGWLLFGFCLGGEMGREVGTALPDLGELAPFAPLKDIRQREAVDTTAPTPRRGRG